MTIFSLKYTGDSKSHSMLTTQDKHNLGCQRVARLEGESSNNFTIVIHISLTILLIVDIKSVKYLN